MSIGLQEGIDLANSRNSEVQVVISIHEASGLVLFGVATPTVRPDVPLRNGPATIGGPRWFTRLYRDFPRGAIRLSGLTCRGISSW